MNLDAELERLEAGRGSQSCAFTLSEIAAAARRAISDGVSERDALLDALVHAHDTMLMVNHADLGKTDREALYAAREHAKQVIDKGCPK